MSMKWEWIENRMLIEMEGEKELNVNGNGKEIGVGIICA